MAIDIELAVNLMQAVNRGVTGVVSAPNLDAYPTSIDTASLPFVLTWPGPGSFYAKGGGYKVDDRTFRVLCFLQPLAQDDLPSNAVNAVQLLQAMRETYIENTTIALADPDTNDGYQIVVTSSTDNPQSDNGITPGLQFRGVPFIGFELQIRCRILWL